MNKIAMYKTQNYTQCHISITS